MAGGYLQGPIMHGGSCAEAPEYARLQIRPDALLQVQPQSHPQPLPRPGTTNIVNLPQLVLNQTAEFPTKRQGPVNSSFDYTKCNARRLSPSRLALVDETVLILAHETTPASG
jgi:hypothetical protein